MIIEERYDLGRLVTFVLNKRLPIYNWFYFKEGFSRDFVTLMIDHFRLRRGKRVLDPFCGIGATLLASKERGINSFGIDADPLFVFVSKVKTRDYDTEELRSVAKDLFSKKFEKPEVKGVSSLIKRAFPKYALEDIAFFKGGISEMVNPLARDFFNLALMVSAMEVSYAVKDGAVIKFFKKPSPPLRRVFKSTVKRWIRHLEKVKFLPCETEVRVGDARDLDFINEESFDAIITSPPYLNRIEYTKIYAIERELFLPEAKVDPVMTYIGLNPERKSEVSPELDLPDIAKVYFSDMKACLNEMFRVLKKGGKVALVVGGGFLPEEVRIVESDKLVARLASEVGFEVERMLVVNKEVATVKRTVKVGEVRESVLLMEKR